VFRFLAQEAGGACDSDVQRHQHIHEELKRLFALIASTLGCGSDRRSNWFTSSSLCQAWKHGNEKHVCSGQAIDELHFDAALSSHEFWWHGNHRS
jgi:hypothetical protein